MTVSMTAEMPNATYLTLCRDMYAAGLRVLPGTAVPMLPLISHEETLATQAV